MDRQLKLETCRRVIAGELDMSQARPYMELSLELERELSAVKHELKRTRAMLDQECKAGCKPIAQERVDAGIEALCAAHKAQGEAIAAFNVIMHRKGG